MKEKLELAKALKELGVPLSWILKHTLGMSSDEVLSIMKAKLQDVKDNPPVEEWCKKYPMSITTCVNYYLENPNSRVAKKFKEFADMANEIEAQHSNVLASTFGERYKNLGN